MNASYLKPQHIELARHVNTLPEDYITVLLDSEPLGPFPALWWNKAGCQAPFLRMTTFSLLFCQIRMCWSRCIPRKWKMQEVFVKSLGFKTFTMDKWNSVANSLYLWCSTFSNTLDLSINILIFCKMCPFLSQFTHTPQIYILGLHSFAAVSKILFKAELRKASIASAVQESVGGRQGVPTWMSEARASHAVHKVGWGRTAGHSQGNRQAVP